MTPEATKTKICQLYISGLSFIQIARATGVTKGSVAGHCYRAGLCRVLVKAKRLEPPRVASVIQPTQVERPQVAPVVQGTSVVVPVAPTFQQPRPISLRQREALADLRRAVENTK